MCGIVGIVQPGLFGEALLAKCMAMVDALAHRGPDGQHVVVESGFAFGHSRLAIVELSKAGAQPMRSSTGRSLIVFNGEIYNHKALRKELQSDGIVFKTNSDTEVLLAAYEAWGENFVGKLNGIFAFAIYDQSRNNIILARDRLGIKPLYFKRASDTFCFGSEIKSLASTDSEGLLIDRGGLLEFLSFQNYFTNRTLFQNIELFPAGHVAILSLADLSLHMQRFWTATVQALDEPESVSRARIDSILRASVARQMEADVPVNSFLSGGIDSCAIAALASRSAGRIKTFTCGFGLNGVTDSERQFDERSTAELVAATLGSEHYETVLHSDDFLARMHDWAWHAEEPRVGSSFPNFCVSGLASRFTKVCMSGTGGDELFAGYPWRYQFAQTSATWDIFVDRYYGLWHRMMTPEEFQRLTRPISTSDFDSQALFRDQLKNAKSRVLNSSNPFADSALIFEAETFLQGLLIVEDKASMAHGLEVRVPLLDNEVIDAAFSTPIEYKLAATHPPKGGGYGSQGSTSMPAFTNGKKILRDVLSSYVPKEVATGRKQGFSPPFETWFRSGMKGWIDSEVFGTQSPLRDYLDISVARAIWREHISEQRNHRLFIWGMISLYLAISSFMRRANCVKN